MSPSTAPRFSRRHALTAGAALFGSLAGCVSVFGDRSSTTPADPSPAGTATTTARDGTTTPPLHVQSGSELHRVLHEAVIAWNLNPKLSDRRWVAELDTDSDGRLADHFCRQQGIEPTSRRSTPPVPVVISHSEPTAVVRDLAADRVDLGDTRYRTAGAISESLAIEHEFVGHIVATAGSVFVVSPSIFDGGVTSLRAEELRDIYAGETTNWGAVGGPDREICVVAGPNGSPPRWVMDTFFDGAPEAGVDERIGEDATRVNRIRSRDDAVGEVPVGFAASDVPPVGVRVDGTRYSVSETGYPTTVAVSCYTRGEPDPRERAFVSYLQSPAGQRYVGTSRDYLTLGWEADR